MQVQPTFLSLDGTAWTGLGAIANFLVVITALFVAFIPIVMASRARKAKREPIAVVLSSELEDAYVLVAATARGCRVQGCSFLTPSRIAQCTELVTLTALPTLENLIDQLHWFSARGSRVLALALANRTRVVKCLDAIRQADDVPGDEVADILEPYAASLKQALEHVDEVAGIEFEVIVLEEAIDLRQTTFDARS